jgi:hypothetical protein
MDDLIIVKGAEEVIYAVNGGNVRKKRIPEACALSRAFNQASDVRH